MQIKGQIMRANAENRSFDFSFASIQMNLDLLARFQTLYATRNASASPSA